MLRAGLVFGMLCATTVPSGAPLYIPSYAQNAESIDRLLGKLRQVLDLTDEEFILSRSAASAWFALGPCQFKISDIPTDGVEGIQIIMGNDISTKWRVAASAIVGIYSTQGLDKVNPDACRYAKEHASHIK